MGTLLWRPPPHRWSPRLLPRLGHRRPRGGRQNRQSGNQGKECRRTTADDEYLLDSMTCPLSVRKGVQRPRGNW